MHGGLFKGRGERTRDLGIRSELFSELISAPRLRCFRCFRFATMSSGLVE
jgi:hypothetical protein